MNRNDPEIASVGIIGSADGPTSVLITGKNAKLPFRVRLSNAIQKRRWEKAKKRITAHPHTLQEVERYAQERYGAQKVNRSPERGSNAYYEIAAGDSLFELEIDYAGNTFGVSFSGGKKAMKQFKTIARDLYGYFGVSERDIAEKTERYFTLLHMMSL